jgi:cyclohexanecarboxylate-CoA ligase
MSVDEGHLMDEGLMLTAERIEAMTAQGHWLDRTIVDYLDDALRTHPDKLYVTDHNSTTGRSTSLSYRQIDRISRRIGAGLNLLGVKKGDVVAMQLPNWWEFAAIHLACMRIGAITNPLQPIFRERELEFMLSFAQAKILFVPRTFRGFDYPPMIDGIRAQLPTLEHVFAVGGDLDEPDAFEAIFIEQRCEDQIDTHALFEASRLGPNEVAEVCYTSGTTGQPKGVMHTYNTLVACTGPARTLGFNAESVILMASPLAHQTGFLFGMLLPMMLGARAVFQDIWEPVKAAQIIHDERVTFTMGATPFLSDLASSDALDRYPSTSLELFICAGAPIPRVLAKTAAQRFGARICSGWGMSENGLVTATQLTDPPEKVFGTDGISWPGQEVRIVDENRAPVGNNIVGNLQTRGAANFVGYLKRPEAYSVDEDGWFDTGDIAIMDEDGYIRITSRAKDIIIRGGENIPVVEIEELLYRHPAIADAAVVAMPDQRMGERGCAFVSLKPQASFSFEQMQGHFGAERLAKTYWPERLEIIAEFPRTPSGKIQKFILREQAAQFADA